MTIKTKIKSHPKPVVDFKSNPKSVKSNKRFYSEKYQSDNHTNNQQMRIDCLKPRSNKNELEYKKCGCDYFYVPNYLSFSSAVLSIL